MLSLLYGPTLTSVHDYGKAINWKMYLRWRWWWWSTGKCINIELLIWWNFPPSHGISWRGRGCALSSLRYTCSPSPLQASLSFLVPVGQCFCLCSLMSSDNSHLYHCLWPPSRHIHLLIPKCHFGLIKNERPVLGLDQLSSTTLLQPVRTGSDPNTCSHNR